MISGIEYPLDGLYIMATKMPIFDLEEHHFGRVHTTLQVHRELSFKCRVLIRIDKFVEKLI